MKQLLDLDWSPEQISRMLKKLNIAVSHAWIYQYVHKDFTQGGTLYLHLRLQLKRYKNRLHKQRGRIVGRCSIHDRPSYEDDKSRFGDWGIDTVVSQKGGPVIVSALERKSLFCVVKKSTNKTAEAVANTLVDMLAPYQLLVHTITADNGLEFAHHKTIAKQLGADVYFADPYASYQRGANKNANGLLRQYLPKGTDFNDASEEDIRGYQTRLNYRPRKTKGYQMPAVIFKQQLLAARASVAVGS